MEAVSKAMASLSKHLAAIAIGEPGCDTRGALQLHMTAFICMALALSSLPPSFLSLVATTLVGLLRNLVYCFQAPDDLSSVNVKSLLLSLQVLSLMYVTI